MESKLFSWNFEKQHLVVSHLADQQRYDCAFSGQNREGANKIDLDFYNSDPASSKLDDRYQIVSDTIQCSHEPCLCASHTCNLLQIWISLTTENSPFQKCLVMIVSVTDKLFCRS